MSSKIGEISQAFEQLRFTEALALIEQTLKKNAKQDKKQKQLSTVELKVIQCFKTGSLISLGRHHQASISYQQLIQVEGILIMGKENPLLFLAISQLFGQNKQKSLIQLLEKHCPNFETSKIQRFFLNTRMFSILSKLFLKEFMTTKNNMFQLGQVYLQYLQNINKVDFIQYQRDFWYKYNPTLKESLKLVNMFLEKCLKTAEQSKIKIENELKQGRIDQNEKIKKQLEMKDKVIQKGNQLKFKIAINQGRIDDAIKIYHLIRSELKLPFVFIRSILKLKESVQQKQLINQFYIKEMQKIFKTNLNFQTYSPLYDYYQQFFVFIKTQSERQVNNLTEHVKIQEKTLDLDEFYSFNNLKSVQILNKYYNSLIGQYTYLTNPQNAHYNTNKKSDYYKICLKGLLLQIIEISHYLNNKQIVIKYLHQYTKHFSNTLTYSSQLQKYWKILIENQIIKNPQQVTNDNQLISQINYQKINISINTSDISSKQELFKIYQVLIGLYRLRVKQIQKNRKLEKGQRYISDQFIIILGDYIRAYIQHQPQNKLIESILSKIINELEYCVQVSSYNADLKLRLMYFLSLVNHHERLIEVYITNDIKSVQMETLGYWFLKQSIQYGIQSGNDYFVQRMVRSYQENQRQTSEYGLKALKAGELDRVQEYLSYRNCITNSYNSIVIYYMLFHRYRFQINSSYYLQKINEKITKFKQGESFLTFNADFTVMKNTLFSNFTFGEFYGLYNSYDLLQKETNVYLHQNYLINTYLQRNNEVVIESIQQIDKLQEIIGAFQIKSIFDFSKFTFQEQKLDFNLQNSKKTLERNQVFLDIFKYLMKIRILNIRFGTHLVNSIKNQTVDLQTSNHLQGKIVEALNKLKDFHISIEYRAQIRSLVSIRRSLYESYNLINLIRQSVTKNKKLKNVKPHIEAVTSKVLQEYFNALLTIKWSEKRYESSGLISKRDEALERLIQIDAKQIKRVISKYQNAYKI